jgi:hypothetical protein
MEFLFVEMKSWRQAENDKEILVSVVKEAQVLRKPHCQGDEMKGFLLNY